MILRRLGALALLLPLIEIVLFVQIGARIGFMPILVAVVLSAIAGVWLLRRQGRGAAGSVRAALIRGDSLPQATFDTLVGFLAGVLLIVPGFFSDLLALLLLIRPLRRGLGRRFSRTTPPPRAKADRKRGRILEGEYSSIRERRDKR